MENKEKKYLCADGQELWDKFEDYSKKDEHEKASDVWMHYIIHVHCCPICKEGGMK